jgi:hypothetical protein
MESNRTRKDINLEIRKRKCRWIGHTLRKEDGEIPKAALFWNPQGNRKRGRPRNSWRRSVIKEAGRSWKELRFLAAYHHHLVHNLDIYGAHIEVLSSSANTLRHLLLSLINFVPPYL